MADINPFANPPVFRYGEVLTLADLAAIKYGYEYQFNHAPWYRLIEKTKFFIAIGTINALVDWLQCGKPIVKKDNKK